MRCRIVRFTQSVRTGTRAGDHQSVADIDSDSMQEGVRGEDAYRKGTIDVYYGKGPAGDLPGGETGERYCIIRSPKIDQQTREPFVNVIPLERVTDTEPLSEAQWETLYPEAQRKPAAKARPLA